MIQTLAQLLKIQQRLNHLAKEKTDYLKQNAVQELERLLKVEETEVNLLEEAERKRQMAVTDFIHQHDIENENVTMSTLSRYLTGKEKDLFEKLQIKLGKEAVKLKNQNTLNDELTKQSLYFVNVQLEMLSPKSTATVTYQPPSTKSSDQSRRSIFDSKA